jgi:hypothetical protein
LLIGKLSLISRGGFLELISAFFELRKMVVEALLGGSGLGLALLELAEVLLLQIANLLLLRFQLLVLLREALFQLADLHLRLLILRAQLLQLALEVLARFRGTLLLGRRLGDSLIELLP